MRERLVTGQRKAASINILEKRGSNFNYSEERRYTIVTLCNGAECLFGVSSVVFALSHSYIHMLYAYVRV